MATSSQLIAITIQGSCLVALALYLGHDGVLLTGWLSVLGIAAGIIYQKKKGLPPIATLQQPGDPASG